MECFKTLSGLGMGGDGLMELVIVILMILIVLGGYLLGALPGEILARRLGWSGTKRLLVDQGLGAIGAGAGVLVAIATFFGAPSPQVGLSVPPGFAHDWVIFLEDRKSSVQLVWKGVDIPLFGKKTVIDVPPSGIVRVRDLSVICCRGGIMALWSDGSVHRGFESGRAPQSTDATGYVAFSRSRSWSDSHPPDLPSDKDALGAYIAARERGAQ